MLSKEVDKKIAILLRALDSDLRRELIRIAREEGALDADGFYNAVLSRGFDIRYKESVYKELQLLVQADLLDKYYDVKSKKIRYRLVATKVMIDLTTMESFVMKDS